MNDDNQPSRCGFVALVGRPNVGKSTLLNHMLGQKVSITSRKPQTTRNNVQGIKTEDRTQIVFVDTPGLHLGKGRAINRYMNQAASTAIRGVDLVVFLVDRWQWTDEDDMVAERLESLDCPLIIAVNKVDKIPQKDQLLPHLAALGERFPQAEIVPLSALRNTNLDRLETLLRKHMPEGPHHYPDDQLTDRSARFMASEMVREKLTRQLGDELPHQMAVEIEQFKDEGRVLHISALILVERPGQKRILIGEGGERIKQIGSQARQDMERLFEKKVMLNLWVKVKSGWSDDNRALRSLGYDD